jgi:hypothetical protein
MFSRPLGGSWGFIIALALCSASACGGAENSTLGNPPSSDNSSGSMSPLPEAGGGGGDHLDATMLEASPGDDATMSGGDDASDDGGDGSAGDDGGGSACKTACFLGQQCCSKVGNLLYGKCYSPFSCAPFCC